MIHYKQLFESENSDIKLYDIVKCGNYKWYVIGIDSDIITLLAKNFDFGRSMFDDKSDEPNYKTSIIRNCLKTTILSDLINFGVEPISTRLNDVGCTDKVWLLSVDEAYKVPQNIRKFGYDW